MELLVRFEDGAIGTLGTSRVGTGRKLGLTYEIQGTRGGLFYTQERMNELLALSPYRPGSRARLQDRVHRARAPRLQRLLRSAGIGLGYNDQKIIEAHELIKAVALNQPVQPDVRFAYRINKIIDAADLSCRERRWVRASEFDTEVDRVDAQPHDARQRRERCEFNWVTIGLGHLAFDDLLEAAAALGLETLEFGCGGWSVAPHLNLDQLLASAEARSTFTATIRDHGLEISALNCSGNPLAPGARGAAHAQVVRDTLTLARLIGVRRVVMNAGVSGRPGRPERKLDHDGVASGGA